MNDDIEFTNDDFYAEICALAEQLKKDTDDQEGDDQNGNS